MIKKNSLKIKKTKRVLSRIPLIPEKVVLIKESRPVVPILNDQGEVVLYGNESGQRLSYDEERVFSERVISNEDQEKILHFVGSGVGLKTSLKELDIPWSAYVRNLRDNKGFRDAMEKSRKSRTHYTHEKFYEDDIRLVTNLNISDASDEELKVIKTKLALISKKQDILSNFKKEDDPERFGVHYSKSQNFNKTVVDFRVEIPDDIVKEVKAKFSPTVSAEGDIQIRG